MSHCELELRIHRVGTDNFAMSAHYYDPEQDREMELFDGHLISIDHARLTELTQNPGDYGAELSRMVFGEEGDRPFEEFRKARARAEGREGLRIRLHVQSAAPHLHAIRWELIQEPGETTPLLSSNRIWFSRFLSADDFQVRDLQDRDRVKVLVAVANPTDLVERWQHAPIDQAGEYGRAEMAINSQYGVGQRVVTARRFKGCATIESIASALGEENADVLYLACHGTITDGQPNLLLEDDQGKGKIVHGSELVKALKELRTPPRLVVLASCKSAGAQGAPGLAALAPLLAQAGVPHVLAMQGDVTVRSIQKFMPRFFKELASHGQIDRAVAAARFAICSESDWWMPALYTHSKTGVVWPPRVVDFTNFDGWDSVMLTLESGACLPVLGPGLVESVIGSTRDLAREWAARYQIPLVRNRDDLAQVAQHLAYRHEPAFVQDLVRAHVVRYLRSKFPDKLTKELEEAPIKKGLVDRMISHIGSELRKVNPNEVHTSLARLPVPIYINANRDNLLYDALVEQGKSPRIHVCTWDSSREPTSELDSNYVPTPDEPLIFHVFGNFKFPDHLIITEDDYFEFLMGVTRNEARASARIPSVVSAAIADSGWLMLGFQVEDWDFRVVLSSVLRQPGRPVGARRASVAIQMSQTSEAGPGQSLEYLGKYFAKHRQVTLFWSSPESFVTELVERFEQVVET